MAWQEKGKKNGESVVLVKDGWRKNVKKTVAHKSVFSLNFGAAIGESLDGWRRMCGGCGQLLSETHNSVFVASLTNSSFLSENEDCMSVTGAPLDTGKLAWPPLVCQENQKKQRRKKVGKCILFECAIHTPQGQKILSKML